MKLMRRSMIALALCAVPAVVVGQVATACTACTHVAPVYMGAGGFIATATDGTEKVSWLAKCGRIARTGDLAANDDGIVSALWTEDNGLACTAEDGGSFEVGPVMDGGWFWVTDEKSSAVGNLINKGVLDNDAVALTSAGAGVTMTAGKGAVYLKEKATGRVGILPNILPEKPAAPIRKCGYTGSGERREVLKYDCVMGDGGTMAIAARGSRRVPNGANVVRPVNGKVDITVTLWGNGSGHYASASGASGSAATVGHVAFYETRPPAAFSGTRPELLFNESRLFIGSGPSREVIKEGDSAVAGISVEDINHPANSSRAFSSTVSIVPDAEYCSSANNISIPVKIAFGGNFGIREQQVIPPLKSLSVFPDPNANSYQEIGNYNFRVVCPSGAASAHQGRELVPENPFPVE